MYLISTGEHLVGLSICVQKHSSFWPPVGWQDHARIIENNRCPCILFGEGLVCRSPCACGWVVGVALLGRR